MFFEGRIGRLVPSVIDRINPIHREKSRALFDSATTALRLKSETSNKPIRSVMVRVGNYPTLVDGKFTRVSIYGRIDSPTEYPDEINIRIDGRDSHLRLTRSGTKVIGSDTSDPSATPQQIDDFLRYVSGARQGLILQDQVETVFSSTT